MRSLALVLALTTAGNHDAAIEAQTLFALWDRYCSLFSDVMFLYEGTAAKAVVGGGDPVISMACMVALTLRLRRRTQRQLPDKVLTGAQRLCRDPKREHL